MNQPHKLAAHWLTLMSHLRIGWWMLVTFVILGALLEAMHGFKLDLYLNVERTSTRVLWTLAHASGTLLGLVHIAFSATLFGQPNWRHSYVGLASACLNCASILCPAAFLVAGAFGSPGSIALGFVLAIPGILFFFLCLILIALGLDSPPRDRA